MSKTKIINDNKASDPVNRKWEVHKLFKSQKKRLGEDGEYLFFQIREEGKLGALAFLTSELIADLIVEEHNAGI